LADRERNSCRTPGRGIFKIKRHLVRKF
jgi:hypothetical protein